MKLLAKLMILIVLLSLLVGCGTTPTTEVAKEVVKEPEATQPPAEPQLTAAEAWAKANGVGPYQPATEDWAAVEEAAKKEGKVVVYANSSKIEKLIEKWNELYPEIALEGGDTDDIAVKWALNSRLGMSLGMSGSTVMGIYYMVNLCPNNGLVVLTSGCC
jgi:iron(III) transport system substrate-binding protein